MTNSATQIRPIRTEQDHRIAVKRIEKLIGAAPHTAEEDELDVLATLVDAYEAKHHRVDVPDAVTAIEFRMEQQHLTRKDLEPLLGSRARVSEVLTGRRPLTLAMVRRLRDGLGISADLLIGATPAQKKGRAASRARVANGAIRSPGTSRRATNAPAAKSAQR